MKPIADYVTRLRAASTPPTAPEAAKQAEVLREVQADAYSAGYAQAAEELLGIALASQGRTDAFLSHAQAAGVVKLAS